MVKIPICPECEYYIGRNDKGYHICKAFYNGIPKDVFWNGTHKEHISGDNNIVYVRREVKKN